ncbi:MarR family winged helix-turn-helix transcriptional regulator [Brucella sp. H1_1004]
MISDDIVRASSSRAPEAGPAASALALLAHKPGLSIRMLAIGVGLSHAGTVRLVDRLVSEGLIERREHSTDGRARSLYLTPTGKVASDEVLASRDQVIAEGLSILNPDELKTLSDIAERVLRNRLENLEQSYRICRLCCYEGCTNCPVDAELHERGVDREKNDDASGNSQLRRAGRRCCRLAGLRQCPSEPAVSRILLATRQAGRSGMAVSF